MDPAKGDAESEDEHLKSPTKRENKAEKEKNLPSSSSTTDDSSEEDEDDFLQFDPAELNKSLGSSQEQNAAAHNGSVNGRSSPVTSSSPPVQMMARSNVPDPNRIPPSIFTRTKSTAPTEWSVASNESLFSIHVGNLSLTRDPHTLVASPPESQRLQTSGFSGSGPGGVDACQKMVEPSAAAEVKAKGIKEEGQSPKGFLAEAATYPLNLSRHSDASISSFQSFAFPILTGEGRNSSAKVEPTEPIIPQQEKPQQPPLAPEAPKPAHSRGKNKWFSCFSCCSSCC